MTQPTEAQSKLIDKNGNFQLANRGNSVAIPVVTAGAANDNHSFAGSDTVGRTTLTAAVDALGAIINELRTDRDDANVRIGQLIERLEAQGILADN